MDNERERLEAKWTTTPHGAAALKGSERESKAEQKGRNGWASRKRKSREKATGVLKSNGKKRGQKRKRGKWRSRHQWERVTLFSGPPSRPVQEDKGGTFEGIRRGQKSWRMGRPPVVHRVKSIPLRPSPYCSDRGAIPARGAMLLVLRSLYHAFLS